ncbi:MAG: DUF3078 domain-containing protein, partial [Myxococcota bacterium]
MRTYVLALFGLLTPATVFAQTPIPDVVDSKVTAPDEEKDHEGWKTRARIGANVSFNDVRDVVGTVEGTTFQLGVQLDAGAHLRSGKHDWENTLTFNFTQTRTPALSVFLKSADELRLRSTYVYRFKDWLGPFAQFGATTAVARGFDVRGEDFTLRRTFRDVERDPVERAVAAEERIKLTSPFEPVTLNESLGGFAAAVES